MPLIGLVDPSHAERAEDEPGRLPVWTPLEKLLQTAATAEPKWSPWTYELLASAIGEWQERDYISTTMLVGGCSRSKVLERREDFILDVDSLYAALRGTQIHRTLELTARPGAVAEGRFFTTFQVPKAGKVEVSCSPDIVTETELGDYKVTESPPTFGYPWKSHTQQLEYNQYIVRHAEKWEMPDGVTLPWDPRKLTMQHLYIVYLGPKGPKVIEVQHSVDHVFKNGNTGKRKVPYIWPDDMVTDDLVPRLTGMVKALAAYPEWPEGLEEFPGFEGEPGWRCPGKPWCKLPDCLAKRYPRGLRWDSPE